MATEGLLKLQNEEGKKKTGNVDSVNGKTEVKRNKFTNSSYYD